jgi:signal transduction histidine kinase
VRRGSLRLRLVTAAALSILAALALSGVGLALLFERHVERRVETELSVQLDQITAALDRGPDGRLAVTRPPADPRFAEPLSGLYWQIASGGSLLRSRSLWDAALALPADEMADGAVHAHRIVGPAGTELIALERSLELPSRLGGGTMRAVVAVDAAEVAAATRAFAVDLLPYLAFLAVMLGAAAYVQVAVGLRPLAAVRERLAAIRRGGARRLGEDFPDEIRPLAAEVDGLLAAREAELARARARAGDLAHGLKTPLQVLASDVDRLRGKGEDAIAEDIDAVATAMRRHVDRELARARMAARSPDARADIAAVVDRVLAVVVRTPAGARVEWSADVPEGMVGRIDADDLAEALGNLLENAARFARARVAIRARCDGGFIVLAVEDDGPGIPEGRRAEALARGGRLDEAGEGAGLGLAIVRDIAEAWGGWAAVRAGADGARVELGVRP